jgi:hypothetical protein
MKRPFRKTAFILHRFQRAACHALHHRHKAAIVAGQLSKFASWSQATPSFTHCYLAADRGVKFRGTSRAVVRELVDLGFLRIWRCWPHIKGRLQQVTRYVICHAKIAAYCAAHGLRLTGSYADRPRTAADWIAERQAHAKRQAQQAAADTAALADARSAQEAAWRAGAVDRQTFAQAVTGILGRLRTRPR